MAAESSSSSSSNPNLLVLMLDEQYLALLSEEEDPFPVSDDKYATELQLQEVIMSSIVSSLNNTSQLVVLVTSKDVVTPIEAKTTSVEEVGESSSASFCGICMDGKSTQEMFKSNNCCHVFCCDCVSRHIAAKIQESVVMVGCPEPECRGYLEPEFCRSIVPAQVFDRWANALCESVIMGSQRFYCPFTGCSALMADDGGEVVRESECPNCRRLFCAQCKVPWHAGVGCDEYQKLNEDERGRNDLMMLELAHGKGWKRCPTCHFFVEKTEGCLHITCRCGVQFCYRCGSIWGSGSHDDCTST